MQEGARGRRPRARAESRDGEGAAGASAAVGEARQGGRADGRRGARGGRASLRTWAAWVAAAGGAPFLAAQVVFLALDRASYVACEWWIAKWTEAADGEVALGFAGLGVAATMPAQGAPGSAWAWSRCYFALAAASLVFCLARTQWALLGGVRAADRLYAAAASRVLRAPMAYFDTTPLGRILSRFTFDTEMLDVNMTQKAMMALISVGWACAGVAVLLGVSRGVMGAAIAPMALAAYRLQRFYRASAVDLQRLDAVSRSPLQALLAEALDGAATVRAFGVAAPFVARLEAALDANTSALLCWTCAQRWCCGSTRRRPSSRSRPRSSVALLREQLGSSPASRACS